MILCLCASVQWLSSLSHLQQLFLNQPNGMIELRFKMILLCIFDQFEPFGAICLLYERICSILKEDDLSYTILTHTVSANIIQNTHRHTNF